MSTRLSYAEPSQEVEEIFALVEEHMGFRPNSLRVMAHKPGLLKGFLGLSMATLGPGTDIGQDLKQLVAYAASLAAACLYCQAHTAHGGERAGISAEKLEEAWNYENSPLFEAHERVAMRFAQRAASFPNRVETEDFAEMRAHFSETQIVEILSVVALFGFLNRWNDTLATQLEDDPRDFGQTHLGQSGWQTGKHGGSA
jgi:uncharacterized peroxidase-related enzyme